MINNGILGKERFVEYYMTNPKHLEFYDYLNEIINLDKRIDLDENLQNSLIEIDKRHLPQIIELRQKYVNIHYHENNLKKLEDFYNYEKQKVYDAIRIKKLELQMQEKDEKILLLNDEINNMKKIIEIIKDNLLNFNYQYY